MKEWIQEAVSLLVVYSPQWRCAEEASSMIGTAKEHICLKINKWYDTMKNSQIFYQRCAQSNWIFIYIVGQTRGMRGKKVLNF